jgi:mannose-6-phosphate isomerase-like protein (cupin superfamily)
MHLTVKMIGHRELGTTVPGQLDDYDSIRRVQKCNREGDMRVFVFLAVTIAAATAQQVARLPAQSSKTFCSSADVTALIAKAKSERKEGQAIVLEPILQLAPYNANLEYRASVGNAAIHETEAELMYVIDGSGTIVIGGALINQTRSNATNLTGTGIKGGAAQDVAKGDFIMVPENTAHWVSAINGNLVLMTLHVPRPDSAP